MNPDTPQTPREELEARLTALLLGELSADEAAIVRRAIEQDAELARLHERLKRTISLVQEAATDTSDQTAAPMPLRLSDERRQKLLAHFKTIRPKEFAQPRRREPSWLVPVAAAAVLVVLAAISIPDFVRTRNTSQANAAFNKLRQVEAAKDRLSLENKNLEVKAGATPSAPQNGTVYSQNVVGYVDLDRRPGHLLQNHIDGSFLLANDRGDASATDRGAAELKQPSSLTPARPALSPIVLPADTTKADSQNPFSARYTFTVPPSDGTKADAPNQLTLNYARVPLEAVAPSAAPAAGPIVTPLDRDQNIYALEMKNADPQRAVQAPHILLQGITTSRSGISSQNSPIQQRAQNTTTTMSTTTETGGTGFGGVQFGGGGGGGGRGGGRAKSPEALNFGLQPSTTNSFAMSDEVNDSFSAGTDLSFGNSIIQAGSNGGRWDLNLGLLNHDAGDVTVNVPPWAQGGPANITTPTTNIHGILGGWAAVSGSSFQYGLPVATNFASVADDGRVPALGDLPVLGRIFRNTNSTASIRDRNVSGYVDASTGWQFDTSPASTSPPAQKGDVYRLNNGQLPNTINNGVIVAGNGVIEAPRSINGSLKLAGDNSYSGGSNDFADQDTITFYSANALAGAYNGPVPDSLVTDGVVRRQMSSVVLPQVQAGTSVEKTADSAEIQRRREQNSSKSIVELAQAPTPPLVIAPPGARLGSRFAPQTLAQNTPQQPKSAAQSATRQRAEATIGTSPSGLVPPPNLVINAGNLNLDRALAGEDRPVRKPAAPALVPRPEVQTSDNAFSTFSLNVSDVSFKLAATSLEKGQMPDPASVRSEEFINAFDYRDPEPPPGAPIGFAWERARYPFAHNRDLLRFSIKTAAAGRQAGRPLNLVLLLDNSGSMERADRVRIIHEALRVLAGQLQPQDRLSVVTFARTARLWADCVPGSQAGDVLQKVSDLTPQGGTNLEEAMNLAYETALRHYLANGINRVVILTDGAANLGNTDPAALKQKVEAHRKQGVALDCFGIGWEGFNDDLLEVLSRNGDGRYGFINTPEEAATGFAGQLAGALQVAASDVKVQVEFNPKRVTAYRQIGYAKHQLTKQQFRDNTVDAAEIAAQEAGNALYTIEVNPAGDGPLCTVRCRFKIPGTTDYREHAWDVPYTGNAVSLEQSSPAMRLAGTASAFSEWLVSSPFAAEVTPDQLLSTLSGVPKVYGADARPQKLEWMIRQAKSIAGK